MSGEQLNEAIEKIVKHYGIQAQLDMGIEEASEFIKAISKIKRAGSDDDFNKAYKSLTEETADIYFMILQFTAIFGFGNELMDMVDKKIKRQISRIEKEEAEK